MSTKLEACCYMKLKAVSELSSLCSLSLVASQFKIHCARWREWNPTLHRICCKSAEYNNYFPTIFWSCIFFNYLKTEELFSSDLLDNPLENLFSFLLRQMQIWVLYFNLSFMIYFWASWSAFSVLPLFQPWKSLP